MNSESGTADLLLPIIIGTALFSVLVAFIIYFIFQYRQAQLKMKYERQHFEQALLKAEVEIREHTLAHVSRELHDNLGQIASLIKINLNMVSSSIGAGDREKVDSTIDLVRNLISDIKSLSLSLNTNKLKNIGLVKAIENDVLRIRKTGQVAIEFSVKNEVPLLNPEWELLLYRVCQEAMSNVLQHSDATNIDFFISAAKELTLLIKDNGKGFEQEKLQTKSLGLSNMRERCKIIGATLDINSRPGHGTTIEIKLPLLNHV